MIIINIKINKWFLQLVEEELCLLRMEMKEFDSNEADSIVSKCDDAINDLRAAKINLSSLIHDATIAEKEVKLILRGINI